MTFRICRFVMFDDVKPSELVCLIYSEKFQSLKNVLTFEWYLMNVLTFQLKGCHKSIEFHDSQIQKM